MIVVGYLFFNVGGFIFEYMKWISKYQTSTKGAPDPPPGGIGGIGASSLAMLGGVIDIEQGETERPTYISEAPPAIR